VECRQGESASNIFDSTNIKPQWRDQYPKTSLGTVGYIGDTYPLCNTGDKASFLNKGSTFVLTGDHSEESNKFDTAQTNIDKGRFTPRSTTSNLYTQLCGPRTAGGKCSWPTEVQLQSTLACDGDECHLDRIRTVKMIDGTDVKWYSYFSPPCVTLTFFNGVRTSSRHTDSRWSCADPTTAVASPVCCEAADSTDLLPDAPAGTWYFAAEMTTLATANTRCAAGGAQQCSLYSETRSGRLKRQVSSPDVYAWTDTHCHVQVQVHPNGDVNVVDNDASFPTGTRNQYALNNDNKFKVRWTNGSYPLASRSACGNGCTVGYGNTCVCNTTTVNGAVYTDANALAGLSKTNVLTALFIGAFPSLTHNNHNDQYVECTSATCTAATASTSNGITRIWYRQNTTGDAGSVGGVGGVGGVGRVGRLDHDTICEVEPNIVGNPPYTLYNRRSTVFVGGDSVGGGSVGFRNPPKFNPMFGERTTERDGFPSSFNKPQAQHETDALIQHLFEHANTAPFVSHRLIQRMVTSNPSPRYVDAVATAFRTGAYNGVTYSGKYGDLQATTMAIFLDREARSYVLDHVKTFGKLREPLLKVLHTFRALEYEPSHGQDVFLNYMETKIGQWSFNSPSVFSFFLPEYQPPGKVLDNGLVAPEAELGTAPLLVGFLNGMRSMIDYGLTGCKSGYGTYNTRPNRKCETRLDRSPNIYNTNDGTFTYASDAGVDWVLHELNTLLASGRMNDQTMAMIKDQYNQVLAQTGRTNDALTRYGAGNTKDDALRRVLKLFVVSSPLLRVGCWWEGTGVGAVVWGC
jgi:cullin-associated NEDD8-dissociated protein 1